MKTCSVVDFSFTYFLRLELYGSGTRTNGCKTRGNFSTFSYGLKIPSHYPPEFWKERERIYYKQITETYLVTKVVEQAKVQEMDNCMFQNASFILTSYPRVVEVFGVTFGAVERT
jgi:hypothetical protein